MGEQTRRFAIATLLSVADVTVLREYGLLIRRTWSVPWQRAALLLLLLIWALSAAVIWLRVYPDLKRMRQGRRRTDVPIRPEVAEGQDV